MTNNALIEPPPPRPSPPTRSCAPDFTFRRLLSFARGLRLTNAASAPALSRAALQTLPQETLHRARNLTKAKVYATPWPPGSGRQVVVKDMRDCPLWYRFLHGRRVLRREMQILAALECESFLPRFLARLDADGFVMEYRDGVRALKVPVGTLPIPVLLRLEEIVSDLHARGITHGDLHPSNVLVAPDGSMTLLDWATAHTFGAQPKGLNAWLFSEWRALDLRQIAKLKARHAPELLTVAERAILLRGGSLIYRALTTLRYYSKRARGRHARSSARINAEWRARLDSADASSREIQ